MNKSKRDRQCSDPRLDMLVSLLNVVKESLAELVMINAQMEKLSGAGGNSSDLDTVLLKLYTMLIQLQSAKAAIESESEATGTTQAKPAGGATGSSWSPLPKSSMTYREYLEMTSLKEHRKFNRMGPIGDVEVSERDIEAILKKLL